MSNQRIPQFYDSQPIEGWVLEAQDKPYTSNILKMFETKVKTYSSATKHLKKKVLPKIAAQSFNSDNRKIDVKRFFHKKNRQDPKLIKTQKEVQQLDDVKQYFQNKQKLKKSKKDQCQKNKIFLKQNPFRLQSNVQTQYRDHTLQTLNYDNQCKCKSHHRFKKTENFDEKNHLKYQIKINHRYRGSCGDEFQSEERKDKKENNFFMNQRKSLGSKKKSLNPFRTKTEIDQKDSIVKMIWMEKMIDEREQRKTIVSFKKTNDLSKGLRVKRNR